MDYLNVLVVDDEQDFLETLINRLRRRSINVAVTRSGKEALLLLEQYPVDVVVLDVKMPGMDGIQTLQEIKRSFPSIEVIILSVYASTEVSEKVMALGAFDYLIKPVEIDDLVCKLHDAGKTRFIQHVKIDWIANQIAANS